MTVFLAVGIATLIKCYDVMEIGYADTYGYIVQHQRLWASQTEYHIAHTLINRQTNKPQTQSFSIFVMYIYVPCPCYVHYIPFSSRHYKRAHFFSLAKIPQKLKMLGIMFIQRFMERDAIIVFVYRGFFLYVSRSSTRWPMNTQSNKKKQTSVVFFSRHLFMLQLRYDVFTHFVDANKLCNMEGARNKSSEHGIFAPIFF